MRLLPEKVGAEMYLRKRGLKRTPNLFYTTLFESHGNFDNNAIKFHRLKLGEGNRAPPQPLKTLGETACVKYGVFESDTPIHRKIPKPDPLAPSGEINLRKRLILYHISGVTRF